MSQSAIAVLTVLGLAFTSWLVLKSEFLLNGSTPVLPVVFLVLGGLALLGSSRLS